MATRVVRGVLKGALVLCVFAAFWNGACSTTEPTPLPGIAVTPAALTFNDTVGTAAPASQAVAISADGRGTLTGLKAAVDYASGTAGWLTLSLSDTTAPATVTLTSSLASLTPGTYHATVVISATDASNSPQLVPVTFDIAPPVAPTMVLSPTSIAFNDTLGAAAASPQTVAISAADTAAAPLTGLAVGSITYVGAPGWLNATLSRSDAPATLTLTENKGTLPVGNYSASVPITSSVATNSPQTVNVTLTISRRPPPPPPTGNTVTLVLTANLGKCGGELGKESAKLVAEANPNYVFVLGNNALPDSGRVTTLQNYMNCYDPVWGQFKSKTYATLGDHEVDIDSFPQDNYGSGMAPGADAYFGADRVGPPGKNWYSIDLGSWHVIGLNVQTPGGYKRPPQIAYHAGSDQLNWLIRDLRDHSKKCTLAVWYESMWISSTQAPASGKTKDGYRIQDVRGVWTALPTSPSFSSITRWALAATLASWVMRITV